MKLTKKQESDVWKVYNTWLESYLHGDVATYAIYLDKNYRFIGSTNNEEFLSKKDTPNFFKQTADQLAGKTQLRNETKIIEKFEELVFVTHLFDAWFLNDTEWNYYGRFRFSNALKKDKDEWRFIYQHFSTADPKAKLGEVRGIEEIRAENLQLHEAIQRRTLELEQKNRELEVETALERVRSVAMSMYTSEGITNSVNVVFKELEKLGLDTIRCGIGIFDDKTNKVNVWTASSDESEKIASLSGDENLEGHPLLELMYDHWLLQKDLSYILKGKDLIDYYKKISKSNFPVEAPDLDKKTKTQYYHCAMFPAGGLFAFREKEFSEEVKNWMKRFSEVFHLSFIRHQDLKKAEVQAREVQIELALERVRAKGMAMRHTSELQDVVNTLSKQFHSMNMDITGVFIAIPDPEIDKEFTFWGTSGVAETYLKKATIPFLDRPIYTVLAEAVKSNKGFFTEEYTREEKIEFFQHMFKYPPFSLASSKWKEQVLSREGGYTRSAMVSNYTTIFVVNHNGRKLPDSDNEILQRFGKIFEQCYIRFLDLQKAEAQARESEIELGLERVRARTMAMQHSDELQEASFLLDQQVRALGIKTWGCAFNIYGENESSEWFGNEAGVLPTYKVPRTGIFKEYYQKGQEGELLIIKEFAGEECKAHYEFMSSLPIIGDVLKQLKANNGSFPTYQIDHVVYFKYGYLLFITREPVPKAHEIFKRFAKVFQQTYTRFLDLKKAEAQAREAQIQLSLERVRAKSMAMQSSDELHDVLSTLFQQFNVLGIQPIGVFLSLFDKEKRTLTYRASGKSGMLISGQQTVSMDSLEVWSQLFDKWKNDNSDEVEVIFYPKEILPTLFELLSDTFDSMPAEERMTAEDFPDGGYTMHGYTPFGYLGYNHTREATEEEKNILSRFATEFSRVYQRFLDIEKAEAQAREARIEAGLERVRSRSMAMHNTSELQEVIHMVHKEFINLNIASNGGSFIAINKDITTELRFWGSGGTADTTEEVHLPRYEKPFSTNLLNRIKSGPGFFTEEYTPKEKKEFFTYLFKHEPWSKLDSKLKKETLSSPGGYTRSCCVSKHTSIVIINHFGEKFSDADNEILKRFAIVFEQTYTRFLDLKKAEAQTRESQIEASLERVRSRTLAMQASDELADTAMVVFKQLIDLGIEPNRLYMGIIRENNGLIEMWATDETGGEIGSKIIFSAYKNKTISHIFEAWKKKKKSLNLTMKGRELKTYLKYINEELGVPIKNSLSQKRRIQTIGYFNNGFIGIASPKEQPEVTTLLLERFAAVFNLTYTRFNDLQISEAQAREATIETALEKVRARALAMQQPEELQEVANVLRKEMGTLGVEELEACSIYIHNKKTKIVECWYAWKDEESEDKKMVNDSFVLDLKDTWVGRQMISFYNSNKNKISIDMQGVNRKEWVNYCEENYKPVQEYYGEEIPNRTYHLYKFSQGTIGASSAGDISEESWNLLKRTAAVFSLAYSRFMDLTQARFDLQRLKEEKKKAEETLLELQLTQKQLIQSEKMASLGELTAGIAHEIQNPLNFVNNFSDVSQELIGELKEELALGHLDAIRDILNDITQNLQRIHHHGRRADGIVKGMLQHSRKSSVVKEATDINELCDEFLRLSYHGLRAKDKSFNAKFETDFDKNLPQVNVFPQDMGRVILNLLTNAFYAVNEKDRLNIEGFEPTVSIGTKVYKGGIRIKVSDNGNGISKHVLDKIYQPFFTTKPTGEGTGLGLSMSYDIITKSHGGSLKVVTKKGKGTDFIIELPRTSIVR
mgnify:CR=1 FL=1